MIDAYLDPDCDDRETVWYMNRMDEVKDEVLNKLTDLEIAAILGHYEDFRDEFNKQNCGE